MQEQLKVSGTILQSASHVVVTGGSFVASQRNITKVRGGKTYELRTLVKHVAPHAILNAGGRADPVRCYPGTREEILADFNTWIDAHEGRDQSFRWLSGPAGAGKSAIVQSIAEGCLERKISMANFFFFRADATRNTPRSLAATLLYQILDFYPQAAKLVEGVIAKKPLIFEGSIEEQFKLLIAEPIHLIRQSSAATSLPNAHDPVVLLIDGLDECSSEEKHQQQSVFRALHNLVTEPNSPFIVLVASRAEPHIVMTFNTFSLLGTSVKNTFLDENFRPSEDIHKFVVAEFNQVKRTHHLAHSLEAGWPTNRVIQDIVEKSSGQFIYAATVMRFLANSPASPAYSLEKVQGLRPPRQSSPFAALDAVYTYILSQADDKHAVKDILFAHLLLLHGSKHHSSNPYTTNGPMKTFHMTPVILEKLGYSIRDIDSYVSDLTAIVKFDHHSYKLIFYHASFTDFLCDQDRSGEFHVDMSALATVYSPVFLKEIKNYDLLRLYIIVLHLVQDPSFDLTDALIRCNVHFEGYPNEIMFWAKSLFESIHRLYFLHDVQVYKELLARWIIKFNEFSVIMDEDIFESIPFARELSPFHPDPIHNPAQRRFQITHRLKKIIQAPEKTSQDLDKKTLPWWKSILPNPVTSRKAAPKKHASYMEPEPTKHAGKITDAVYTESW